MAYRLGYHEDSFLRSLAPFDENEIELKADNCTKVELGEVFYNAIPPPFLLFDSKVSCYRI